MMNYIYRIYNFDNQQKGNFEEHRWEDILKWVLKQ